MGWRRRPPSTVLPPRSSLPFFLRVKQKEYMSFLWFPKQEREMDEDELPLPFPFDFLRFLPPQRRKRKNHPPLPPLVFLVLCSPVRGKRTRTNARTANGPPLLPFSQDPFSFVRSVERRVPTFPPLFLCGSPSRENFTPSFSLPKVSLFSFSGKRGERENATLGM